MSLSRILYYNFKLNRILRTNRSAVLKTRERRFRRLLKYALRHSDFYRAYYADHGVDLGNAEDVDIADLPPIDKETVVDHFDDVVVPPELTRRRVEDFLESSPAPDTMLSGKYRVLHTSGTTGTVGYFVYGPVEWDLVKAVSLRMFPRFGLKPRSYAYVGVADGHYAGISLFLSPLGSPEGIFYREYLVVDIGHPLERYVDALNGLAPEVVTGYPSGIGILAELQKAGMLRINPRAVVTGGEPVTAGTKELIDEVWECPFINYYAASESLTLGVERADLEGFYLFDDVNYIEFKDDHILLTNLYNYTQPLIRYRMNDILVPTGHGGVWPFTRIERVIGRQEELLWFANERGNLDFIHPIAVVEFFVKGLEKYQVVKTGNASFTFRAVVSPQFDRKGVQRRIEERWREILRKKEMSNIDYRIHLVDDIPGDPRSGKHHLIRTA
ncbi:MAG: phenylacetate--CoA ligase family protein [Spirochaetaceae bacterium]